MKLRKLFIPIFFLNLLLDIVFNNIEGLYTLRFVTKPLISILLIGLIYKNRAYLSTAELVFTIEALACVLIGDIFMLEQSNIYYFGVGMVTTMVVNVLYALVFFPDTKLNLKRLAPFLVVMLGYVTGLFYFTQDNLGYFFFAVIFLMIIVLIMITMAYSRFEKVNMQSYYLVLLGAICLVISLGFIAINNFYKTVPLKDVVIMLFHGSGHLLIVLGLLKKYEDSSKDKLLSKNGKLST